MVVGVIRALAIACCACAANAATSSYRIGSIKSVERADPPYESSPLEDKRVFDCNDFRISDDEVRFALRHARAVSENYFYEELVSIGCYASVFVNFRNGDRVFFTITPTGRVFAHIESGRLKGKRYYYRCQRCEKEPQPWGQTRKADLNKER